MQLPRIGSKRQPFPLIRPRITVTSSRAKPFAVDVTRMPGWGIALDVGAESLMSWYDPPEWRLTSVSYHRVLCPAEIHGLDGVEIETFDWEQSEPSWRPGRTHFVRLTEDSFQWLAVSHVHKGKRILYTYLDDGFDQDWRQSRRLVEDTGCLVAGADGAYTLAVPSPQAGDQNFGAGVFRVHIGDHVFTCLRELTLRTAAVSAKATKGSVERTVLAESFYSRTGQLILFRRYNGRLWGVQKGSPYATETWDKKLPHNQRLTINGAMFVHWYDCLTDTGCRLGTTGRARRRQ